MAENKDIRNEFKRLEISSNKQNPRELHDEHLFQLSKRITDETTRRELGLSLGLKDHEVKVTRTNNRDEITIATFEMLQKWCQRKPDRHTAWLELKKALREAGLKLYIKEVLERTKSAEVGFAERSSPTEGKPYQEQKLDEIHKDVKVTRLEIEEMRKNMEILLPAAKDSDEAHNIRKILPPDYKVVKDHPREQFIRNNCTQIETGEVNIYFVKHVVTYENNNKRIRNVEIGQRQPGCKEKVIMIVGATGSGKSTLINGMFNYIFGVEWTDDYRLKLIEEVMQGQEVNQDKSQTRWITAYTIHHRPEFIIPYTLTIIDTPGFGDQEFTDQIRAYFTTPEPGGVDSLDAVGFVAQSSQRRLSLTESYIFDSILSLFGRDIGDNIIMLLTFADVGRPHILDELSEYVPYKKYFKLNNSHLFVSNQTMNHFAERMNLKSFGSLMAYIGRLQPKSLFQTKEVLQERKRVEMVIEGMHKDIKTGLNNLEHPRYKAAKEQVMRSIDWLNMIALRPNPTSTVDYIGILICSEENSRGSKERIEQLVAVKEKVELMQVIIQQR